MKALSGFLGKGTGALKSGLPKVTELVRAKTPVIQHHSYQMSSGDSRCHPQPKELELKHLSVNLTPLCHDKPMQPLMPLCPRMH